MGTTPTTNLNWDKPVFPSDNLASELDTLIDQIDADVGGGRGTFDSVLIEEHDLSTLSLTAEDDGTMYRHNGTSSITLVGGETTTSSNIFIYDHATGNWKPILNDAATLNGFTSGEFLKKSGDTVSGTLSVQAGTGDSLLQVLTSAGSADTPTIHLGGDQSNGTRLTRSPDTGITELGNYSSGTFSTVMSFDEGGNETTFTTPKVNAGEHLTVDAGGTAMSLIEAKTVLNADDDKAAEVRVGAGPDDNFFFRYDANGEYGRIGMTSGGSEETGLLFDDNGYWCNFYFNELDMKGADLEGFASYSSHSSAPTDCLYYHDTDGFSYRRPDGDVELLASSKITV